MKRSGFYWLIIVGLAVLTACAQATPEPVTYTIEMSEYAFTPGTIRAKVGQQVTINLVNKGALEHEIMFGQNVKMIGNQPDGYMQDMFLKAGIKPTIKAMGGMAEDMNHGHSGYMVTLSKTGDEGSLSFRVTEEMVGEWEMGCFALEGVHYASGMIGKFIVEP